ncbi:MAG TPA: cysteine desulfurase [Gaiellaceae bacterium]|nr:cysteine desulfurase [Gaiellaceae bacterium]
MAVTAPKKLDAHALRADFPIFEQQFHGKPLAYLDSAASAQKPRQMLDAMTHFYETSYANVHRGVYELAERATEALEHARERCRAFVNAPSAKEIIFVRNATEALNLVAYAWGLKNLGPGDVVLVTELEHHANFVPWQYIAGKSGASFRMLPVEPDGTLHLEQLDELAGDGNVKVVATGYVSNVLGGSNDIPRIAAWAHERGAIHVCDAAQAAPHKRVDVQALGSDFVAVSGHKMCGPSGIGFLWGKTELLLEMDPFLTGGHMIRRVREDESTWGELPHKFEAGTAPMAEAVGLGAAIDYLEAVGLEAIEQHEHELVAYALGKLDEIGGVTQWGPPADRRAGIISFDVEGVHPHDVAQILDLDGVAIRAGHHCCQPLMGRLGVVATNRASFYLYTVPEEIDRLAAGLVRVKDTFGV